MFHVCITTDTEVLLDTDTNCIIGSLNKIDGSKATESFSYCTATDIEIASTLMGIAEQLKDVGKRDPAVAKLLTFGLNALMKGEI